MVRIATRRQACEEWDRSDICPNIIKRVQKLCFESRTCKALMCREGEYEVLDGKSTLKVSLNKHSCWCNAWQISGIPCKHGMRAILADGQDPLKFVSDWHSVKLYKRAYSTSINSIPDFEQWPNLDLPNIEPPTIRRSAGRPTKNRKRADDEERKGK